MEHRALKFTRFLGVKTFLITALCLMVSAVQSQTISPFITTWQTDASRNIIIPLTGAGYDFSINWGDGAVEIKTGTPNNISHNYATAGVYTVTITPNTLTGFPRILINNFGNRALLRTIAQWGGGRWSNMNRSFYGANTMQITATDTPDFSAVTSFDGTFLECTALTGNPSMANWRFSTDPGFNIDMSAMFQSASNFNQDISSWNMERVTNMRQIFNGATVFNQDLNSWDVSNATNMNYLFANTNSFNNLGNALVWGNKVSKVTSMNNMFLNARAFNQDISGWDVSNVIDMSSMFSNAQAFNSPLNTWNVGKVTNMGSMFQSTRLFNQDINGWNVSSVTNMGSMFYDARVFNQNISAWDVSKVTNMNSMLRQMPLFNQPLDGWGAKTGNVTNMQEMFRDSPLFNQSLNSWDVSKVTTTSLMFYRANSFNQDLPSWNFASLVNATSMFQENSAFNGNITTWQFSTDPTRSINLSNMFNNAAKFNQDISAWNVSRVISMNGMFTSTTFFNQDISAWDVSNVTDMANMFNNALAFNSPLNWGAKTAKVTNMGSMFQSTRLFNQDISGWNVSAVTNMGSMFFDARVFNQNISAWDVSMVTNMTNMFRQMPLFNQPLDGWGAKTGRVTNMQEIFRDSPVFNQPLNSWDVSKVTNMAGMFQSTTMFNQPLNSWDVSKVTTTSLMFYRANSFNQDLPSWNFASLVNATSMFQENTAFNGNITTWQFSTDPARSINFSNMFNSATKFNQDISAWNVSRVTNMNAMFISTPLFNQDISAWDVSNVTDMANMFNNAQAFNSPLNWAAKTAKVTNMGSMFQSTRLFNQDISGWNVSSVTNMGSMFFDARVFNQNISAWDVTKVTNMANMFRQMPLFNQPLDGWGTKTGRVTNMQEMFRDSPIFNQPLNSWDVSKVTNTIYMFYRTNSFNQDLNSWDLSSLTNGTGMFQENTAFNGNISNWKFSTGTPATVNLTSMFQSATSFDKNLGAWNISFVNSLTNFLNGSKICRQNYDATLKGWSTLDAGETRIPTGLNVHFGTSKYSNDATVIAARTALTSGRTWAVTDGGVETDYTNPTINGNVLAANNNTITITLSDRAFNSCKATSNLKITDFTFSIAGGVAALSSVNPTSITTSDNITFVLGLGFSVPANGAEILTVNPTASSIFDAAGNELGVPQSNNTAHLNDLTPPVISGPAAATGASSSISVEENQTAVFSFTANEAVTWSLGTSDDKVLFAITSSGVVTFNESPDFEIPSDANTDNNYLIEVVATDAKGNISKQIVTITVTDVFDLPATLSNFNAQNKMYFDGSFTISPPTSNNSTGAFTYTSSNTAVATISGSTVTLKGIGVSTIKATQAGDGYYTESSISATLTVTSVDVLTNHGELSNTKTNYVNANGAIGSNIGVDSNGKLKTTKSLNIAGLVMHLDADNTSSYSGTGNTWFDLSGNNNHISWSAPAPQFTTDNGIKVIKTTDATGVLRAMVSTNYNNLPTGNEPYTAISFFKPNSNDAAKMILSLGPANNLCGGTQIHPIGIGTSGKYAGGSCGGLGTWQDNTGVTPSTSSYVCVATTYGSSTEKVYVNGNLDRTATMTTNIPVSAANKVSIGWVRDDGANYTMDANIGIILFYNRELSASEITQIYNTYRLRFGLN